jgi:DNA (cytosine-5)-methyltransferase 1
MIPSKSAYQTISLFSGCGGLDLGFSAAGFDIIWANEIMHDAAQTYQNNCGHSPVVDDIWNIIESVPQAEIVIGGPPCQAFSLVGKRLENDPRAKLVFAYKQIIERIKPKAFVMENVPGLLASRIDGKSLVDYLAGEYARSGYSITINHLLASDYCVPQRRKRVVMIGTLGARTNFTMITPAAFQKIMGLEKQILPVSAKDALSDLPPVLPKGNYNAQQYTSRPLSPYAKLMRRNNRQEVTFQTMPTMSKLDLEFVKHIPPGGNYMSIPDSIATKRIKKFKQTGGRTTTYGRLHPDYPAYTITTYFNRPNVGANYHYEFERLITVREALRLQSFPDDFVPFFSNQRNLHIQIGNAVPPLLARAIAESLKESLYGS